MKKPCENVTQEAAISEQIRVICQDLIALWNMWGQKTSAVLKKGYLVMHGDMVTMMRK
jgi:hypothetical protein